MTRSKKFPNGTIINKIIHFTTCFGIQSLDSLFDILNSLRCYLFKRRLLSFELTQLTSTKILTQVVCCAFAYAIILVPVGTTVYEFNYTNSYNNNKTLIHLLSTCHGIFLCWLNLAASKLIFSFDNWPNFHHCWPSTNDQSNLLFAKKYNYFLSIQLQFLLMMFLIYCNESYHRRIMQI